MMVVKGKSLQIDEIPEAHTQQSIEAEVPRSRER